jgi:hypothetical protein
LVDCCDGLGPPARLTGGIGGMGVYGKEAKKAALYDQPTCEGPGLPGRPSGPTSETAEHVAFQDTFPVRRIGAAARGGARKIRWGTRDRGENIKVWTRGPHGYSSAGAMSFLLIRLGNPMSLAWLRWAYRTGRRT